MRRFSACLATWLGLFGGPFAGAAAAQAQNLFVNGDFETGTLAGWSEPAGATIVSSPVHGGAAACRLLGPPGQAARIRQVVSVQPGAAYRAFVWIHIVRTDIVDWGFINASVSAGDWTSLASVQLLAGTHGTGQWFKVALRFTAIDTLARFEFSKFAHPASDIEFLLDDATLLPDDGSNLPPQISIVVSPAEANSLPATVSYELTGDDLDGAIEHVYWDFGDGGHALNATGQYTYVSPGVYTVRAYAQDDQDAVSEATTTVVVTDATYPQLVITTPAEATVSTEGFVLLSGQAVAAAEVRWSTDRGEGGSVGGGVFAIEVPLHAGRNRLLVNAFAGGAMTLAERTVFYHPAGALAITDVEHAESVERWEPLTVTCRLVNSRATTFDWPYDPDPPPGLPAGRGVSVDAEFSDDGFVTVLPQPAFYYRGYVREQRAGREWLYPSGSDVWMARFAPPRLGTWQVRLRAEDAGGATSTTPTTFVVLPPTSPHNHGFVRVDPLDPRCFRFEDGTPFAGVGHGGGFGDDVTYEADAFIAQVGSDSADFFRLWLSGANLFGSAWIPWASRTLTYEGTVPPTGLTAEQGYDEGRFSTRLDAANPVMFAGFSGGDRGIQPGRTHRVRVRAKLIGVTGPAHAGFPFGLTVKRTGWPEPPDFQPGYPAIVAHQSGSRGWCVYEGDFLASGDFLGFLCVMLENATGGTAFLDEVSLRELLPDGRLGPELLRRGRANYHLYFDPVASYQYDHVLRQSSLAGHYYRLVITEKQDHILTRLGSAGFVERNSDGRNFDAESSHPSGRLQEYYWRYLTARYGAERSVHSWELANEQDPGSTASYAQAERLAAWLAVHDPHQHYASTSFWATFPLPFWGNPAYPTVCPADVHAYVPYGAPENEDAAEAHLSMARQLAAHQLAKPIIRGETALSGPEGTDQDHPDLVLDTAGVWLHNFTWAQLDAAPLYELYWHTQNIRGETGIPGGLYHIYRSYRTFFSVAAAAPGPHRDAAAATDPALRVVGRVAVSGRRGCLWIQNRLHTWRRVVDGLPIPPVSATVTIPNLPADTGFRVRWFNTQGGVWGDEESLVTRPDGRLLLAVQGLTTDVAVFFEAAGLPGDLDGDSDVDQDDLAIFVRVLVGLDTDPTHAGRADLNGDQRADGGDIRPMVDALLS